MYTVEGGFVSGPLILKIDMGPGRLTKHAANREMQERAAEKGLIIFPGLQNTTACSQEQDELYAVYQALCAANMDRIVEERMTARAAEQAAFDRGEGPAPTPIVCLGNECSRNCF